VRSRNAWEKELRRASRYRFLDSVKITCGCIDCGYDKCAAALEFDHPPGSVKLGNVGDLAREASWQRLLAEMEKCEVVCANCHRERTVARRKERK
jgi:hypothetical protein